MLQIHAICLPFNAQRNEFEYIMTFRQGHFSFQLRIRTYRSRPLHIKYFCVSNEIFVIFEVAPNEIHTILEAAGACLTFAPAIRAGVPA